MRFITEEQGDDVKKLLQAGYSMEEIHRRTGISLFVIGGIKDGTWYPQGRKAVRCKGCGAKVLIHSDKVCLACQVELSNPIGRS